MHAVHLSHDEVSGLILSAGRDFKHIEVVPQSLCVDEVDPVLHRTDNCQPWNRDWSPTIRIEDSTDGFGCGIKWRKLVTQVVDDRK